MKILYISDPYPTKYNPQNGVFSYTFVQKLDDLGHKVIVISPMKFELKNLIKKPVSYGEENVIVHRPLFFSASAKNLGIFNTYQISHIQKVYHTRRLIEKYNIEFDIIICQFIQSAMFGIESLKKLKLNTRIYVDVGENNNIAIHKSQHRLSNYTKNLNCVDGFVAVSDVVKDKLISLNKVEENKIIVAENGTNLDNFKFNDKIALRTKYNFIKDKFILIFVGRFVESKGPLRVLSALKNNYNVQIIFLGSGPQKLVSDQIIWNSPVPKDEVPLLMGCADAFILPTLHEGSNNAIIEAMAAGLPIISSNIPEVKVQVNNDMSILVDPLNIHALEKAIKKLSNNPDLTHRMSLASLKQSKKFDITKRVDRMLDFFKK